MASNSCDFHSLKVLFYILEFELEILVLAEKYTSDTFTLKIFLITKRAEDCQKNIGISSDFTWKHQLRHLKFKIAFLSMLTIFVFKKQ